MSRSETFGSIITSITGTFSQLSSAIASVDAADKISVTINRISGFGKAGIFGAVSIAISKNRTATVIGIVVGTVVTVGIGTATVPVAVIGVVAGGLIGWGVDWGLNKLGIGVDDVVVVDLDASSPNPADQIAGYTRHDMPRTIPGPDSDGDDKYEGVDLDGSSPNPADQKDGYTRYNTPTPPEPDPDFDPESDSDGGDRYEGVDLDGSSPNPADQKDGYTRDNTPTPPDPDPDFDPDPEPEREGGGDNGGSTMGGFGKPVVLDLDGDGVELIELDDSAAFYDIHGTGYRQHLSWAAADDGILAYDRDEDGVIAERGEISFVEYLEGARTDLEGLRHFDTNGDGVLDAADAQWGKFRVWQDADGDGVSDEGELRTLEEAGIRSISLMSTGEGETRADGTRVFGRGTYEVEVGGEVVSRELFDVGFRTESWGIRETDEGVAFRWSEGGASVSAFVAGTDDGVVVDVTEGGYRAAIGGGGADRLSASGDEGVVLIGMGGGDTLEGGAGDDLLLGGAGDDVLDGGAGADVLDGGDGADHLDGGAGRDVLYGGAGADVLTAGGNEEGGWQLLYGGSGGDRYRIGRGDGRVFIAREAEEVGASGVDVVEFVDVSLAEVEMVWKEFASGEWLVMRWSGEAGGSPGELWVAEDGGSRMERYEFACGSTLGGVEADYLAREWGQRLAYKTDDRLRGTEGDDVVVTGAQDDEVYGLGGNDRLSGGAGVDNLYGGDGDDVLYGGAGYDVLRGGAGADVLNGGASRDILAGGLGDDTYEFEGRAFGRDRISDEGGQDVIRFSGEVSWDQLWFSRSGRDLEIGVMGTDSEVTVREWWGRPWRPWDSGGGEERRVERVVVGERELGTEAVTRLVEAMARMGGPSSGQTELTQGQREQMAVALAGWEMRPRESAGA